MKRIVLIIGISAATIFANAQTDTIQFSWIAKKQENKEFWINYAFHERLMFDWGDGSIDTITMPNVTYPYVRHTYSLAGSYTLIIASVDTLSMLDGRIRFGMPSCNLTSLDISKWRYVETVDCESNHLTLSNLYAISERISALNQKGLGTQRLLPQRVLVGDSVDYSSQKEFGGIATIFTVNKNSRKIHYYHDQCCNNFKRYLS